jgi:hemoglobin-like flavoprotein
MSFASVHSDPAELERYHVGAASLAELVYPYTARVTRHDWQLLLDSWERLQPNADRFATAFFDALFTSEPELRLLFGGTSLETQFIKFAHLLTELVSVEDDPHELAERIDMIAHRYAGDASGENDHAFRAAIRAMLAEVSLARLTPDARQWWKAGYAMVDTIIRKGSRLRAHGRLTTFLRRTRIPNC